MAIYLGLDCGGSSCRAVAVDSAGNILHQGQAGPANLANTPPGKLQSHVLKASRGAPTPNFVCGCFAGLLTSEDRIRAEDLLRSAFPGAIVRAEPDYIAAFMANDGADVTVIAGTGSLICSRHEGRFVKSGGGGYILGDVGSAYQYGRAALLEFMRKGSNGISDALRMTIEDRFGATTENEVLAKLYRGGLPAAQLAKLAPALAKDFRAGEAYAIAAVEEQASGLSCITRDHVLKYLPQRSEVSISLAGGLWEGPPVFRTTYEAKLREALASVALNIMRISKPPVHGAVQLARELAS